MAVYAHPGQYRQRVIVYQDSPTTNPDGEQVEGASEYCRRFAAVEPIGGRERELALQMQADLTHRVRMHSDSTTRAITPAMWLQLPDGTRLDIERVFDRDLRRVEIELECKERV